MVLCIDSLQKCMNAASAKVVPKASLKVGFLLRADRTREDSMRWRILSTASRSTPHREATCDNLLRGDHYREHGHKYPRKEKGQLTCTVTMASPVSKTNVLEKTLTTRPARKPTVNKCQTTHNLPSQD